MRTTMVRRTLLLVLLGVVGVGAVAHAQFTTTTLATDAAFTSTQGDLPIATITRNTGPHAAYANGVSYAAYLAARNTCAGGSATNFCAKIATYTHATQAIATHVVMANILSNEIHQNTNVFVDTQGYLHYFLGSYGPPSTAMRHVRSTNTHDASAWNAATFWSTDGLAMYPNMFEISANNLWWVVSEWDGNQLTDCCTRPWQYKTSTDNGATWSAKTTLLNFGTHHAEFGVWTQHSDGTMHVAWNDTHWTSTIYEQWNVHYAKSSNGTTWTDAAGNALTVPLTSAVPKVLTTAAPTEQKLTSVGGIAVSPSGKPYIVFYDGVLDGADVFSATGTQGTYALKIAYYTTSWQVVTIDATASNMLGTAAVVPHDDTTIDVLSSQLADTFDRGALKRYRSTDGGASWTVQTDIESGDAALPITVLRNGTAPINLVYSKGTAEPAELKAWGLAAVGSAQARLTGGVRLQGGVRVRTP